MSADDLFAKRQSESPAATGDFDQLHTASTARFSEALVVPQHALQLSPHLRSALEAALQGGNIIREGFGRRHTIEEKGIGDLVSEIDARSDAAICLRLRSHGSEFSIISEELNPNTRIEGAGAWIVDPLDATSAFLFQAGRQYSSVMVALHRDGEIQLGVVLFPLTAEWFYSERGKGAFKNGEQLRLPDEQVALRDAWVDMNQYGDARYESEMFRSLREKLRLPGGARLVTSQVPHSGVAMRMLDGEMRLAAAIHDNNPHKVKQAPWDIAAPQVIMEEAGGVFLNPKGERTDLFEAEPIIVARSKQLAREILQLVPYSV